MADTKITERYEFKTDIITAWDGHEQRIKTRQLPRHFLTYDYSAMNAYQAQWLKGMNRIRQSDLYYIPMWHNPAYLAEDFIENGKALYIEKEYMYNFYECDWIEIFFHDDFNQTSNIVREVSGYSDGIIRLKKKIEKPLLKLNTWIFPLRQVSVQPSNSIDYVYSNGSEVSMSFEDLCKPSKTSIPYKYRVEYFEDVDDFNEFHLPLIHNNREVFAISPQWLDDNSNVLDINKNTNKLDNETGLFMYDLKNTSTYDVHTLSLYLINHKLISNTIKFFIRMGGMYKSFYCPTWANDFEVDRYVLAGTNFLYTKFSNLYKFYAGNGRRKSIVMFTKDRQSYIFDIMSYSYEVIGGTRYGKLTLAQTIPRSFDVGDILMVSYFNLVRFDSDSLKLDYESNIVAGVDLVMREVDDDL